MGPSEWDLTSSDLLWSGSMFSAVMNFALRRMVLKDIDWLQV